MADQVQIDWSYEGKNDGLAGTGATVAERVLAYGFALVITFGLVAFLRLQENPATYGWRLLVLMFFAFDILGGVVANMLNSVKRVYHAPLQAGETGFLRLVKNPLIFSALHIHPIVFAWVFWAEMWIGLAWYIALIASVAITLATPLYLRRPTATAIVILASLVSLYSAGFGEGLEWFIPALFFKIVS